MNVSVCFVHIWNHSFLKKPGFLHTQRIAVKAESYKAFTSLEPLEINFQTWHGEHTRTCKSQLIYNATERFSTIQSKIQSVGADEFSQCIPDKMLRGQLERYWWVWGGTNMPEEDISDEGQQIFSRRWCRYAAIRLLVWLDYKINVKMEKINGVILFLLTFS